MDESMIRQPQLDVNTPLPGTSEIGNEPVYQSASKAQDQDRLERLWRASEVKGKDMGTAKLKGHKRAVLYIRVSTEMQGEKASPVEQEREAREYCAQHDYTVTEVYKDTERYRVGKRLVEPSGSRHDRPQFQRMLADADAGRFEIIVAWREDRLYRGYRPMLDVLERVEQGKMSVELVKEHFDPAIAPIKAWAARMELKARSERTAMGRAARYANNKIHPGSAPYGYRVVDNVAEPHPAEALWVKRIFDWYRAGVSYNEIRRRLIAGGAPQRQGTSSGKGKVQIVWQKGILQKILRNAVYATGKMSVKMSPGQHFTLTLPPLISPLMWERT